MIQASTTHADFQKVWKISLDAAQEALQKTPDQLKVLKDAGVVDAAGQGFLNILEGVMDYMDTGNIRILPKIDTGFSAAALEIGEIDVDSLTYPFCTECIIIGEDLPRDQLSKAMRPLGDSIVIAGSKHRAKVHIHTDDPGKLFAELSQFGEVQQQKVDDMREQNKSVHAKQKVALVVDSTCDLPADVMEHHHIHVVPVRLNFGQEQFIDRVTITNEEFYAKLADSKHHPQTSQPPPADFKRMYQFLSSHYESVISLHLPQVLSGTYQNASAALEKIKFKENQALIDSLSVSAGTGLIAMEIAEAIAEEVTFPELLSIADETIHKTEIYIALKTLDAVQRGGRLSVGKKRLIDILGLNLVLSITDDGYLKPCGVTFGRKNIFKKFERFVLKKTRDKSVKRVGVVHGANLETAEKLKNAFDAVYPEADVFVSDFCPALGVHGGVGAVGVAVQYR